MKKLDERLNQLKTLILDMGSLVEKSLKQALEILLDNKQNLVSELKERERKINSLQIKIAKHCFKILAKEGPVAKDLRLILAIISINTDLERMGDLALNIANKAMNIKEKSSLKNAILSFKKMFSLSSQMAHLALKALVDESADQAKQVLLQDDAVDKARSEVHLLLVKVGESKPHLVKDCITLVMMAGQLERTADHATNIAEEVVFLKTARDIRHQLSD